MYAREKQIFDTNIYSCTSVSGSLRILPLISWIYLGWFFGPFEFEIARFDCNNYLC